MLISSETLEQGMFTALCFEPGGKLENFKDMAAESFFYYGKPFKCALPPPAGLECESDEIQFFTNAKTFNAILLIKCSVAQTCLLSDHSSL